MTSLPSRERGLKHVFIGLPSYFHWVAPFTGAWIETFGSRKYRQFIFVAPFTGAWIETGAFGGLSEGKKVAPFTGAWIETKAPEDTKYCINPSLPSRERGLKLAAIGSMWNSDDVSLPSRERGLKL